MTDVQVQEAGTRTQQQTKRAWLLPALTVCLAVAVLSLAALIVVATDLHKGGPKGGVSPITGQPYTHGPVSKQGLNALIQPRVVAISTPTAADIKHALGMRDEMALAIGQTAQVTDPQTGLAPRQSADALRWQGKAEAYGIKHTGGLTFEGLKGDTKNDLPGN
jgi:hypothetical protein